MAKRGKKRKIGANFAARTLVMTGTFCLLFSTLVGRLAYLQIMQGKAIRAEAREKRRRPVDMTARRGSIFDRHDIALATNKFLGDVVFDCRNYPSEERYGARFKPRLANFKSDVEYVAKALGQPPATVEQKIQSYLISIAPAIERAKADLDRQKRENPNGKWKSLPVPYSVILGKDIDWEKLEPLRYPAEDIRSKSNAALVRREKKLLEGFDIVEKTQRVYAMGEEALHVVGKVITPNPDDEKAENKKPLIPGQKPKEKGVMGLEQGMDAELRGEDGKATAELYNAGSIFFNTKAIDKPKRDGNNVYTTLDQEIQHLVMKEAQRLQSEFHPKGVSIVVLDPFTGDLLGLASTPTLDPAVSHKEMTADEVNVALTDRCSTYLLEPGSILKTLTIASGLELGKIKPSSTYFCSGALVVGNKTIHCDAGNSHKLLTILGILQHSCNIGSAQIGQHIGGVDLRMMFERFGICDNLDLPVTSKTRMQLDEAGRFSVQSIATGNSLTKADLPRVSFGHSVMTTPIHIALAYGAIANGGTLMKARLVTKIVTADAKTTEVKPTKVRNVVSPQVCTEVTEMLRSVVSGGTGRKTAILGYQVAGKTGTARKKHLAGEAKYTSSFVGFVPASENVKPRAVILVMVDEPQGALTHGGDVAGPAFNAIAKKTMELWRIPKDDPNSTQLAMSKKPVVSTKETKQVAKRDDTDDVVEVAAKHRRRHN
ncbi:MAG: penicillin-binding protein 2 [Armatimonadetes bacterium]|nr:penicillin-binding protein 2 [Armatimonadota bacterium]